MAKKSVLGMILTVFVTFGVFAIPDEFKISLGVGSYSTYDSGDRAVFHNGDLVFGYQKPYAGVGGYLFLDAAFAELSFGYFSGIEKSYDVIYMLVNPSPVAGINSSYELTGIDIGIMGKLPFLISSSVLLYPLLGISYQAILTLDTYYSREVYEPSDFSAFWIKFGGGMDSFVSGNIFIRFGIIFGMRIPSKFDNDMADLIHDYITENFGSSHQYKRDSGIFATAMTVSGLETKLAIGYRF